MRESLDQAQVGRIALDQAALLERADIRLDVRQRHELDGMLREPVRIGEVAQVAAVEEGVAPGIQLALPATRQREVRRYHGRLPVTARERDLDAAVLGPLRRKEAQEWLVIGSLRRWLVQRGQEVPGRRRPLPEGQAGEQDRKRRGSRAR